MMEYYFFGCLTETLITGQMTQIVEFDLERGNLGHGRVARPRGSASETALQVDVRERYGRTSVKCAQATIAKIISLNKKKKRAVNITKLSNLIKLRKKV